MSTFDKKSRCLKTFQNLNFIQDDNQPNLESMRIHILDCFNALIFLEAKELIEVKSIFDFENLKESTLQKEIKKRIEESDARRQVFAVAILMSLQLGGICNTVVSKENVIRKQLLEAFPDDSKMSDCRGWLPLHFAVLASSGWYASLPGLSDEKRISIEDSVVKIIYEADIRTLERHHLRKDGDDSDDMVRVGYTPLHFLCLEEFPDGPLLDYFALNSPESFTVMTSHANIPRYAKLFDGRSMSTISTGSCLHLIAKHNMYNESVIEIIIRAAPEMVMTKGFGYDTPLSGLCGRYGVANENGDDDAFYWMFYSLLEANHSSEIIKSPPVAMLLKDINFSFLLLKCCFQATDPSLNKFYGASNALYGTSNILKLFTIILNANPKVAGMPTRSYRNEEHNIFQVAASLLKGMTNSI
jgi:hypothetical protein